MTLKRETKSTRIYHGNKRAEYVREYKNHRFHANLETYSGSPKDTKDCLDYGNKSHSFQCKVRDKYDDIIFESDRYYVDQETTEHHYKRRPGRDARCKADYYVVKPFNQNRLACPTTKSVKEIIKAVRKEWGLPTKTVTEYNDTDCVLFDVTDEQVHEWFDKARHTWNKSIVVFSSEKNPGVQIHFKIEEGDTNKYGKLLFYIPFKLLECGVIELRDNEVYDRPDTWQDYQEESLDAYLR